MTHPFHPSITLKSGSHKLPSEGSCAMEVAILAAGYAWSSVESSRGLPPCMSRVIGAYVIRLNDGMPDGERQKLMSFVTRMSGTAATPEIEQQRAEYLVMHAAKDAAVSALKRAGLNSEAQKVFEAKSLQELEGAAGASWAARAAARAAASAASAAWSAASAASAAWSAAWSAGTFFDWQPYLDALDGALSIGPQANPIDIADIQERTRVLVSA